MEKINECFNCGKEIPDYRKVCENCLEEYKEQELNDVMEA